METQRKGGKKVRKGTPRGKPAGSENTKLMKRIKFEEKASKSVGLNTYRPRMVE